jgi:hypothetical protein
MLPDYVTLRRLARFCGAGAWSLDIGGAGELETRIARKSRIEAGTGRNHEADISLRAHRRTESTGTLKIRDVLGSSFVFLSRHGRRR